MYRTHTHTNTYRGRHIHTTHTHTPTEAGTYTQHTHTHTPTEAGTHAQCIHTCTHTHTHTHTGIPKHFALSTPWCQLLMLPCPDLPGNQHILHSCHCGAARGPGAGGLPGQSAGLRPGSARHWEHEEENPGCECHCPSLLVLLENAERFMVHGAVGVVDDDVLFWYYGYVLSAGSHWWYCFVWVIVIMVMFCQQGVSDGYLLLESVGMTGQFLPLALLFITVCCTGTHLFDLDQCNILIIKQRWSLRGNAVHYESLIWWGKSWWEILEAVHHCERQIYEEKKKKREKKRMEDKRERRKTIDLFIRCVLQCKEVLESQILWPLTPRSWETLQ